MSDPSHGFGTRAVHGGPLREMQKDNSLDLNFRNDEMSALENKSKLNLEKCIASLEHAKYALSFSSGTAATISISQLLEKEDHVVVFDSVYHGTRTYFTIRNEFGNLDVTFADLRNPSNLEYHLRKNTKLVWIETPSNPTMKLVDIEAISTIVKRRSKAILVVDNTFMTPYFQNPLLLGADIVMHSLTKYMNGHGDVLMGAAATNNEELFKALKESARQIGSFSSPMDCYLVLRGLKTLHLRMERHNENSMKVARFLEKHPKVEKVNFAGLESHPQHNLALRQCRGFSGMVSFYVKGGTEEVRKLAARVKIFTLSVSLGSAESLMDISSLMTAGVLPKEKKEELGISDNLVRLSIGLESARDLIEDLNQALRG